MFPPPLSCLFLLFGRPLFLPFGKLPLPLLALEKRLYLREQDTGQSLHLMVGYPGAVVVGFLFPRHLAAPCSKPFLVKQVALKHCPVVEQEAAPCVLWYLLGGAGIVQDDLRENAGRRSSPLIQCLLSNGHFPAAKNGERFRRHCVSQRGTIPRRGESRLHPLSGAG